MHRILTVLYATAVAVALQTGTARAEDPDMSFDQPPPAKGSHGKDNQQGERRRSPRMNELRDVPNEGQGEMEGDARTIPAFFEELFPDRAKHMHEMQDKNPGMYRQMVWHVRRLTRELMQMKRTDKEEFESRVRIVRLEGEMEMQAMKLKMTTDAKEKAALEKELRKTVGTLYDEKESAQRRHIKRMEKDMADLKARIEKRRKSRDKIIDRKVEELKADREEMEF
jgi:hypothetical protein